MSGCIEQGTCDICHKEGVVINRKYYYYKLDCECCVGNYHFEIVRYCNDCEPSEPIKVMATQKKSYIASTLVSLPRNAYDRNNDDINAGDWVEVQKAGVHQVYLNKDRELAFKPYGKEELVLLYFSADLLKTTAPPQESEEHCECEHPFPDNGYCRVCKKSIKL